MSSLSRITQSRAPQLMMTSSNGNIFRVTGLLCGEFTGPGEFPSHKGQWRGALICTRTNRWVNNHEAGDLRRHQAHYDVRVMCEVLSIQPSWVQHPRGKSCRHITDVIMGTIASQITSLASVYSTVYSAAGQRNYQSSASLAFVRGRYRAEVPKFVVYQSGQIYLRGSPHVQN